MKAIPVYDVNRFELEQKIQACENELNTLLAEIKERRKSINDLKTFLERKVRENPHAIPLLCSKISATINSDLTPFEYLQTLIINSYNIRIASGDNEAQTQKYNYQLSHGLIADITARPLLEETGEV